MAAANGKLQVVKALLSVPLPMTIFAKTTSGKTPLGLAKQNQHATAAECLKTAKLDVIKRLWAAVNKGDGNRVCALLKQGVPVNVRNATGRTALHAAAAANQNAIAELLVAAGAEIDAVAVDGRTPLIVAVESNGVDIANQLLQARASVHMRVGADDSAAASWQPLHLAAKQGYAKIVDLLLAHSAIVDAGPTTPLHLAVQYKHVEVVKRLLKANALRFFLDG
ncbi:hypothetical protein SDRG_12205 [Saprolegnia diclina VS20]|uniref:Uncharacterized protein n=1 Tax=Saprolegnia diclina (strain VS20) TaxID=1156394 RepID=T0RJS5_SAPDV|nr:hypothetical protein SDRG_12205 [Saprolegnia diclina VS20]EQC30147.1 hypothetical protein SDRG_12205 [Saprolegnia diclina VS20]|eukprot:XP_008616490.1 hypothetical protein SDRG_12205 [Saprolegnia diclina VS20]